VINANDVQHARVQARQKLFQPTTIRSPGGETRAHLLDLSGTGALVHATTPPMIAARVQIGCAGEMRAGRVVWVRGNRFGIVFTVPLTPAEVAKAVAGAS
jgi:hypothetical protein